MIRRVAVCAFTFHAALAAPMAATTYSYQGHTFVLASALPYTLSLSVAGSFQVAAPLPFSATTNLSGSLLDFSFNDGVETRNLADSLICAFSVTTDASGNIVNWSIWLRESVGAPQHSLETYGTVAGVDLVGFAPANVGCGGTSFSSYATTHDLTTGVRAPPGVWTDDRSVVEVPAVSEIGLAFLAAVLVAAALWRLRLARVG